MKLGHRGDAGVPQDYTPSSARTLTSWCQHNNLQVNVSKTKELMVGYRKQQGRGHAPIDGTAVESAASGSCQSTLLRISQQDNGSSSEFASSFNPLSLSYSGWSLRSKDFTAVVECQIYGLGGGVKISICTDSVLMVSR